MTRRYKRANEKIHGALHRLVVGEGDVRDRLKHAYWLLRQLSERDLPPQLLDGWQLIIRDLTRRGPEAGPDGVVYRHACEHTMFRIKNSTGRRIAEKIYSLNEDLRRLSSG